MSDTDSVLISGVNWLGDSVMTMPAIQAYRRNNPSVNITMLCKQKLAGLWQMHSAVDSIISVRENPVGTAVTAREVRKGRFGRTFVLGNSFRSALIPFLAGIPVRVGMRGHQRAWMLTQVVESGKRDDHRHQKWEYVDIMGLGGGVTQADRPSISFSGETVAAISGRIGWKEGASWVGLIPGAAYGPSKRWPVERFAEVGRMLAGSLNCRILVLGTEEERSMCVQVARDVGAAAFDLSGSTSLQEFASALSLCSVVITNDSGGMHLASAAGTKVVGVFGMTDPTVTGPMGIEGVDYEVVCSEAKDRSRDLARNSRAAQKHLAAIEPDRVCRCALNLLSGQFCED